MFIQTEATPNPATLKFMPGRVVLDEGTREYRAAENVSVAKAASASHTIPVTVAAEQGVIGLAAYLALLFFAFSRCLRGVRSGRDPAIRAGIAAAFTALVVHTLIYAAFLEDPITWVLLAAATAFGTAAARPGNS